MALDETCNHEFLRLEPRLLGEAGPAIEVYVCAVPKRLQKKYVPCGAEILELPENPRRDWFFERHEDAIYASLHVHKGWTE